MARSNSVAVNPYLRARSTSLSAVVRAVFNSPVFLATAMVVKASWLPKKPL
ncbi:hypothetical protein [Mucilaginibacter sp. CSA2-8R]|uniref:hypothetical protein n=1 Tax=Mucilaginibacter sp. CSA2-8R TaxID=3141542 RepID=UPI00315CC3B3